MKVIHNTQVNARYWTAIILASVFGTNLGDLYAHESGLGIGMGLGVLAILTAIVFGIERFENKRHEAYYWLVIILIRTGATNIADYLAYRAKVPDVILTLSLVALLALFGWGTRRRSGSDDSVGHAIPDTNASYWLAMLTAGVFGTVVGDICEHLIGEGVAAILLTAIFFVVLVAVRGRAAQFIALYWITVAVARTAGTAIGDWLAENKILHIGLPISTLASGIVFVAVLVLWKNTARTDGGLHDAEYAQ